VTSVDSDIFLSVPSTGSNVVQWAVHCAAGKKPLGGGFEPMLVSGTSPNFTSAPGNGNVVFLNLIASAPTADGWVVSFRNGSGSSRSNVQFRVWAVCSEQP
jgi:hypothetical protein